MLEHELDLVAEHVLIGVLAHAHTLQVPLLDGLEAVDALAPRLAALLTTSSYFRNRFWIVSCICVD